MLMLDAPFRTAGKELGKKREGHTWWVLVAGKRWNAATPAGKPWRGLGLSASATFHIYMGEGTCGMGRTYGPLTGRIQASTLCHINGLRTALSGRGGTGTNWTGSCEIAA